MIGGMQSTTTDIRSYGARHTQIRPLTAADRERVADEYSHLSEQTRRRRFGGLAEALSERDLDRLTDIDHHDHEAFAAVDPRTDRVVGIARFIAVPSDPGAAEVAVEVEDRWQGHGIGRRLMNALAMRARTQGITRLLAYVSTDNLTVLDWIHRAGGTAEAHVREAAVYTVPLDRAKADRRAA